ncbi:hypothetical protein M3N55_04740 [Roseibaca sp. V10]|uniref:Uncharacterized protein n=1 Tax=Roseinatronobacter domitianus TaxID=2940293 RepID=A0ABT0LZI7_9RHOB|nr:hypothetical protein [Roseibaca domitiana]MCL1628029.1 hypothetical protein [Roseibaca domitiana]
MKLIRLNKSDGTWKSLEDQWAAECDGFGEDYESYAGASVSTLREECDDGEIDADTGVFSLQDETKKHHAACFLNSTLLKGYAGKVLRVRHLVLSPYYDFEELTEGDYAEVQAYFFNALLQCSEETLPSPHVKLHYRSPNDRQFFAALAMQLRFAGQSWKVDSKGMWLHLSKV